MSEEEEQAERWLQSYHGSIDSIALIMAHKAGQRSGRVRAAREADLERISAKPAQVVPQPNREALFHRAELIALFEPYAEQGVDDWPWIRVEEAATIVTDREEELLAALSSAPLSIDRGALKAVIAATIDECAKGSAHSSDEFDRRITDAVIAHLSAQPVEGEAATQYRAIWPGGSTSAPLPSLIPLQEHAKDLNIPAVIQQRTAHYTPWVEVQP